MTNEMITTQNDQPTELLDTVNIHHLAFVNPADMPNLDAAEVGMSIEKKYFEFVKEGDTVRAVYNGMDFITTNKVNAAGIEERKQIAAIVFQNKEGVYLNSGASLVEQFKTIPAGTPVQISYTGEVKTKSGNKVKKYDVRLLNVKVATQRIEQVQPQNTATPASKQDQQLIAKFWEKAYSLNLTNAEGLARLAEFNGDFLTAFAALGG